MIDPHFARSDIRSHLNRIDLAGHAGIKHRILSGSPVEEIGIGAPESLQEIVSGSTIQHIRRIVSENCVVHGVAGPIDRRRLS